MIVEQVGVSPSGIPVYKTDRVGIMACCVRTADILPFQVWGVDRDKEFAILIDEPFFKLGKKQFEALIGHEEAHAINGDLTSGAPVNEHGILVVPEFELRADAHAVAVTGDAKHMLDVLKFVKTVATVGLAVAVIIRKTSIKEAWNAYRGISEELAPRVKALKALKK